MSSFYKFFHAATSSLVLFSLTLSALPVPSASAQAQEDGIVRDYNAETGKVSMISGADDEPITILSAMSTNMTDEERADALVQSFAPEFGVTDPTADLQVMEQSEADGNRVVTRYQQTYNDIPVMAGELIVNASEQGALYSMNGEVAQGLSLDTTPTLTAEEAVTVAKQGMVKWYQGQASDYAPNAEAALWIFDESLLKESIRPAMLVWRMEMIPADGSPIRELVLVDAKTGNVPLHFNQIDTAWNKDETTPTPTEEPTEEPVEEYPTTPTPQYLPTEEPNELSAQATIYYVDIVNGNDSNTCTSSSSPCQHIQQAIDKGWGNPAGDTIYVTSGTYKRVDFSPHYPTHANVVIISRSLTLSGGWNSTFNTQNGTSIIDGEYSVSPPVNGNNGILMNTNGTVMVENFIIQNSNSSNGGGIYLVDGNFTLRNSTVKNNRSSSTGAGIFIGGNSDSITVINSTISGNRALSSALGGGGIYSDSTAGSITIQNSTIAYNTASNTAGTSGNGGGIHRNVGSGAFTITNTIIANNTAITSGADCKTSSGYAITTVSYSILEDSSGCTITTGSNNLNVDPEIDSALTGTMEVHVLLSGSPAINAGTSTGCPLVDQNGTSRPQGPMCDIGAYEYFTVGLPAIIEVKSGSSQGAQPLAIYTQSLSAVVKDENGFPISGETVTFTAPGSGASGTFADTSSNITTAVTNASGIATSSAFTANSTIGNYVVEATIPSLTLPAEFALENYVSTPSTIAVSAGSPQSVVISTPYTTALQVVVKDEYLNPVEGVTVTFNAPASGASGTFADTSTISTTALTNASGIATASAFTANATGGSFVVAATVDGIASPAQFQLTNYGQTPTTITIYSGSPQSGFTSQVYGLPLKAQVKDQFATPLPGITVTFTAPSSGASGTFTATGTRTMTAVTDANGIATTSTYTANATLSSSIYNVTATAGSLTAQFQMLNISLQTYSDIALDETRGWIYGTYTSGNRIDVISTSTWKPVKSFLLATNTGPRGIALSPDGSELAIALNGTSGGPILFLNPDTGATIATVTPNISPSSGTPKTWDVVYGRTGRLYSSGNPNSNGFDYIHIINTTTHTEIGRSTQSIRATPYLTISANKNTLYVNEQFSPNEMYKFDISDDNITARTPSTAYSGFSANKYALSSDEDKIFTDSKQVWDSNLQVLLGSITPSGIPYALPGEDAIAFVKDNSSGADEVSFVSTNDFYTISTYTLPTLGTLGPAVASSDGNTLYVTGSSGFASVNLSSGLPGTPGTYPAGSLPYKDTVLDETRGVIYGSDYDGNKIDVISISTRLVINSFRLVNGAHPIGLALSPEGSELAVAQNGASSILFLNPSNGAIIASVIPNIDPLDRNMPFDLIYGRPGRLYSSGNPSSALEHIHVIDTSLHTLISSSTTIIHTNPYLQISADKNTLFANDGTTQLWKFDIADDVITTPAPTSLTSGISIKTYLLTQSDSKVFASNSQGQVWSNPTSISSSSQIGSFTTTTLTSPVSPYYMVDMPVSELVAVVSSNSTQSQVRFIDSADADATYDPAFTIPLSSVTSTGPSVTSSDEMMLYVNTNLGIKAINLDPALASVLSIDSGSGQATPLLSQFSQPFKVMAQNYMGQPIAGVTITFTAPSSGPSGTFANTSTRTTTAVTGVDGIATAANFTANNVNGPYLVEASAVGVTVAFNLVNGIKVDTYTANHATTLPGQFLCDVSSVICTNGTDEHADKAHQFALGIYNFYLLKHNRHSFDNNEMPIISTVHYDSGYDNAFWNGDQMVFGDGSAMPRADDVVAHEFTHGVTDFESGLFYFYQSGAINESFSDLWGEYYDQTNGIGLDSNFKWSIGEDTANGSSGVFRSMSNPAGHEDPDKMTSPFYYTEDGDSGGVHYNSGINNKAVYLMVDGDTFNKFTISGIGWDKTAAIYYEVQTNLLSSGSDYSDLYYAVQQACTTLSLTNFKDITSTDCVEVKKALDAVEMNSKPPVANFNVDALVCPAGQVSGPTLNLFSDDFENGTNKWTMDNNWSLEDFYATSPSHMLFGSDSVSSSTSTLKTSNAVILPAGTSYLYFKHAFGFEFDEDGYYDGGVLEYSTDNGNTWVDAQSLYVSGQSYKGKILTSEGSDSTLQGRSAFVGDSHGYTSTQYKLTSLAGKAVNFRWVFSTDQFFSYFGWAVDDVKIYTCVSFPTVPTYVTPASNGLVTDYTPLLDWSDATPNVHHYQIQVATDGSFTTPIYDVNNLLTSQYVIPSDLTPNTTYYWRVRAFNIIDETKGWAATRTFRTALTPPALTSVTLPLTNNRPMLDWTDVVDTTHYTLQISTVNTFASFVLNTTVNGSSYIPTVDLPANKTLYWRVIANGANGPSLPSASSSFSTANPPSVPALSAPVDKSLSTNLRPKLDWANSTSPLLVFFHHYQVQVATDAAFSNVVDDQDISGSTNSEYTPLSDLSPNTTYYWRVRSYSSVTPDVFSSWSITRSFRTALTAPVITALLPLENNRPAFDWSDVPGATGYTIQISTVNTFASLVSKVTVASSTYTPTIDLPANKTLYWRVLAEGANGPSLPSASSSFTTLNPPSIPTLSAPVDNLLVTSASLLPPKLDWSNATVPAGVTFAGYQLQVAIDAAFTSIVLDQNIPGLPSASEFTLSTPLVQNTKYFWRVRSYSNTNHNSSWSLTRSFRIAMPAPANLLAPANAATSQLNRPTFDWDDVPGATSYTLQVSIVNTFASFALNTSVVSSTFVPTMDLPANKTLYWRVIANGPNGPSLPSVFSSFSTANPPSVPTLAAPADNFLVTAATLLPPKLDWNNSTLPIGGAPFGGYQLQVATDATFSSIVPGLDLTGLSASEFTISSPLTQNTKYYWRVRSYDTANHYSSWSLTRSFRMILPVPTLVSPAFSASVATNLPTFDWNDVPGATGYTIQISTVNTFASFVLNTSSTDSIFTPSRPLPSNKTLFWRILANGANGPSLPSYTYILTTGNPASIPTLVAPLDNLLIANTLTPKLDWNNSTALQIDFKRYELQVATDADFSTIVLNQNINGITSSEFTLVTPLSQNTKYFWRVRSITTANHYSGWSLVRTFRIALSAPTLTSPMGTISANSAIFDWDDVAGATYYSIQISTSNTFATTILNTTSSSSTFTPSTTLPANTALYWRVLAQGPNGPSAWSSFSTFTIQ